MEHLETGILMLSDKCRCNLSANMYDLLAFPHYRGAYGFRLCHIAHRFRVKFTEWLVLQGALAQF